MPVYQRRKWNDLAAGELQPTISATPYLMQKMRNTIWNVIGRAKSALCLAEF